MGAVDDVRKLLQDLVTPEMRALATELKNQNEKFENLRIELGTVRKEIGDLRADVRGQVASLPTEVNRRFDYIESSFRLDERVSLLEADRKRPKAARRQQ